MNNEYFILSVVEVVNFLNKEDVKFNLVDETDQIRIELFLTGDHCTTGDYIVITQEGVLCMNLFTDLTFSNVKQYIQEHK